MKADEEAPMNTATTAYRHRHTALASIIAVGALAAACTTTNSGGDPTPPTSTAAPTTTVASPTPPITSSKTSSGATPTTPATPVSATNKAKARAVQVVRNYYALTDAVYNTPSKPVTLLHSVLSNFLYSPEAQAISVSRARGWKSSGAVRVMYARATSASVPRDKGKATVTVKSCTDLRGTRLTDSKGKPVVHRTKTNSFIAETDTVTNVSYPGGFWIITGSVNHYVKSC